MPLPDDVENPLISIILTCYNEEKFVAEAIRGVLSQTYSPLEIVVIDDCSSDLTAEVIKVTLLEYPNRSNIRFIRNPKNMQSATCEIGLMATNGVFVMVSSGDDVMLPEMVTEIAKVWMDENVSLVTTNAFYIDENSNSLNRTYRDPDGPSDDSFETLARDGTNDCCFGPTIDFERKLYSTFGWPPRLLGAYDIIFPFYAYLLKGARFIKKPLLKYRVHASNTSLSLIAEKSDRGELLITRERIFNGHLAHAVLMQEELLRLSAQMPDRYSKLAEEIIPLLCIQTVEMAKKLVRTRRELEQIRRGL